jgi:pimeloyl-ACP methyl ester carboxylesterase
VAAIIGEMGESSATIVAESFGGGVALVFALNYPQMVSRLVIVNSFPRYRERSKINLACRLSRVLPFRVVWPFRKLSNFIGLLVDRVPVEDRRRFFQTVSTIVEEGYRRRLQLIAELDIEERLPLISAPTLLVACRKDLLVRSIREARLMASALPNASVKIFEGSGHACLLGDSVKLADLIAEWESVTDGERAII